MGSLDSFERKLEEAQEDLGIDPDHQLPVTYTNELSWGQEILRLAPTLLLIAGYVWFTRRQMGGFGGGGPGGRGIFNVGKAQVWVIVRLMNASQTRTKNDLQIAMIFVHIHGVEDLTKTTFG